MPETIEVQAFDFSELSDDAKEKARDWYRSCIDECADQFALDHSLQRQRVFEFCFRKSQ